MSTDLMAEILEKYKLTFVEWNNLIKQRGIEHKPNRALIDLVQNLYPRKIRRLQEALDQLRLWDLSSSQLADYQIKLAILQTERRPLHNKVVSMPRGEERDNLVAEIGKLDGEIRQIIHIIHIPESIIFLTEKIDRIKEKFACTAKELEFRAAKLVKRKIVGTTYYVDWLNGSALSLNYTFTNGSSTVNVSGDPGATDGIAVGDYIKSSHPGSDQQWYKVSVVNDVADTISISPMFMQPTTPAAAATLCDVSVKDGTTLVKAVTHLNRLTTDTIRTPGDLIYVRANQIHTLKACNIVTDEDGTVTAFNEVRGCSIADDPWGDGSDVKPIFTFGDTGYYFYIKEDDFWHFTRLDLMESSHGFGQIYFEKSMGFVCDAVDSHDCSNAAGLGFEVMYSQGIIRNCSAYSNLGCGMCATGAKVTLLDTSFYGGVATTDYGISNYLSLVELENVTFGAVTAHDLADLAIKEKGRFLGRNVTFNSATEVDIDTTYKGAGCQARIEDYGGTKLASKSWYFNGMVEKDVGVTRVGGATSSAKVAPDVRCGLNRPLCIGGADELSSDFVIWCPASATTITVYIRSLGVWTAYPTASELYITAKYWDGATAKRVESPHSIQTLTDETTWVAFTTTFTPNSAGWVYVKVYLKKYEANKGIYVDIKPVVS